MKSLIKNLFPVASASYNEISRNLWLQKTLKELPLGYKIIDAGAGEQAKRSYCQHLNYVSQDFAQYDGKGDSRGLQVGSWDQSQLDIVSDITTIPAPDSSFDAVLCVEVFEHLPNPLLALDEFVRLLRPGGKLILTAPFCAFTHFAPYFFCTGFSEYWYRQHLEQRGFEILDLYPMGNFPAFLDQEIQRLPSMAERYSTARLNWLDRIGLRLTRSLVKRMIDTDTGSDEFVNFGICVLAQKSIK